jgi:cytochrome c-type biogenesis protein CcmH
VTVFWSIAALLAAVALAFVLPALLGRRRATGAATPHAVNVAIHRDQLKELDADLAAGTLSPEQRDEARREIEQRLLDDVRTGDGTRATPAAGRRTAIAVAAAVPVAAILLYLAVGNPAALAPGAATRDDHAITREQIEGMVERLAERIKENPDDVKGWAMLGRSYAVLDRYADAVAAYANAVKRSEPDAQLLADYADALAMAQGRHLQGEPERLIAQALKVDPHNVKALMLAGAVAFEKKDFKGAIAHWRKILEVVPPDSDMADSIRDSIADAQALAGAKPPAKTATAPAASRGKVTGRVSLAQGLAARAAPTDTVFIFARAPGGPPLPLAVLRKQVQDLPLEFTLDDSMAMAPSLKLSYFAEVVIGARVSRSGGATPQSGDLQGLSQLVKVGATGIAVVIDTALP